MKELNEDKYFVNDYDVWDDDELVGSLNIYTNGQDTIVFKDTETGDVVGEIDISTVNDVSELKDVIAAIPGDYRLAHLNVYYFYDDSPLENVFTKLKGIKDSWKFAAYLSITGGKFYDFLKGDYREDEWWFEKNRTLKEVYRDDLEIEEGSVIDEFFDWDAYMEHLTEYSEDNDTEFGAIGKI